MLKLLKIKQFEFKKFLKTIKIIKAALQTTVKNVCKGREDLNRTCGCFYSLSFDLKKQAVKKGFSCNL